MSTHTTGQYDQPQMTSQITHPHEQFAHHQEHVPLYGCSHAREQRSQKRAAVFQPNSVVDYPYLLLPSQRIRDLTDVYRREKNFLEQKQQPKVLCYDEMFKSGGGESPRTDATDAQQYYHPGTIEQCSSVPCNCEISLPGRIFQNLMNGIKQSVEFFLFIGYVIRRRDELLESYYPFDRHQTYNSQGNDSSYPFVRHSTDNIALKKLNLIRKQVNRKKSPTKYTTAKTCYIIH